MRAAAAAAVLFNACTRDGGGETVLLVLDDELKHGDAQEHCLLSAPLWAEGRCCLHGHSLLESLCVSVASVSATPCRLVIMNALCLGARCFE